MLVFQLKELKERQKQQLRHKALKKGLDPEALTGKYPVSASHLTYNECVYFVYIFFMILLFGWSWLNMFLYVT